MEECKVLAGMTLSRVISKEFPYGVMLNLPVEDVAYSINSQASPVYNRFTFTKPTTNINIRYSIVCKTFRRGAKVEIPLEVGLLYNGELMVTLLTYEPFYVNAIWSGYRGTISLAQDIAMGDTTSLVLINQGFGCGIDFQAINISMFDGLSGLLPGTVGATVAVRQGIAILTSRVTTTISLSSPLSPGYTIGGKAQDARGNTVTFSLSAITTASFRVITNADCTFYWTAIKE